MDGRIELDARLRGRFASRVPEDAVLIVFAGGPHTASRTALAQTLACRRRFQALFLAGDEFTGEYRHLRDRLTQRCGEIPVFTDASRTTIQSCRALVSRLSADLPAVRQVVVVTSSYHAPRVRWLLGGLLPREMHLTFHCTRDIRWRDLLRRRVARKLIAGEILSWAYCLPVGLCFRIGPLHRGLSR